MSERRDLERIIRRYLNSGKWKTDKRNLGLAEEILSHGFRRTRVTDSLSERELEILKQDNNTPASEYKPHPDHPRGRLQ